MTAEQEDKFRMKKAEEFVAYCQNAENEARRVLAEYSDRTKRAREKLSTLFQEVEARTVKRKLTDYRHCTL